jgi:hypothetical protein
MQIQSGRTVPLMLIFQCVLNQLIAVGIPPCTEDTVTVSRTMRAASPPAMADQVLKGPSLEKLIVDVGHSRLRSYLYFI